jgi:hypothetical protein
MRDPQIIRVLSGYKASRRRLSKALVGSRWTKRASVGKLYSIDCDFITPKASEISALTRVGQLVAEGIAIAPSSSYPQTSNVHLLYCACAFPSSVSSPNAYIACLWSKSCRSFQKSLHSLLTRHRRPYESSTMTSWYAPLTTITSVNI